ncbi:MAG: hypothetical protein WCG06_01845, partial [Candidatus Omnitrophota bacterium]
MLEMADTSSSEQVLKEEFESTMGAYLRRRWPSTEYHPTGAERQVLEQVGIKDIAVTESAPDGGAIYSVESVVGDRYLVFADKAMHVHCVAVAMAGKSFGERLDPRRDFELFKKLPSDVHPLFENKILATSGVIRQESKGAGIVFLPLLNVYYSIEQLARDYCQNPILRQLIKKTPAETLLGGFSGGGFVYSTRAPWLQNAEAVSRGRETLYAMEVHRTLGSSPLHHASLLGHEVAHEWFLNMPRAWRQALVDYFISQRHELGAVIKACPGYREYEQDDLVTEQVAAIVQALTRGDREVMVLDAQSREVSAPILVLDVARLIEFEFLPKEFAKLIENRRPQDQLDPDILAEVYPHRQTGARLAASVHVHRPEPLLSSGQDESRAIAVTSGARLPEQSVSFTGAALLTLIQKHLRNTSPFHYIIRTEPGILYRSANPQFLTFFYPTFIGELVDNALRARENDKPVIIHLKRGRDATGREGLSFDITNVVSRERFNALERLKASYIDQYGLYEQEGDLWLGQTAGLRKDAHRLETAQALKLPLEETLFAFGFTTKRTESELDIGGRGLPLCRSFAQSLQGTLDLSILGDAQSPFRTFKVSLFLPDQPIEQVRTEGSRMAGDVRRRDFIAGVLGLPFVRLLPKYASSGVVPGAATTVARTSTINRASQTALLRAFFRRPAVPPVSDSKQKATKQTPPRPDLAEHTPPIVDSINPVDVWEDDGGGGAIGGSNAIFHRQASQQQLQGARLALESMGTDVPANEREYFMQVLEFCARSAASKELYFFWLQLVWHRQRSAPLSAAVIEEIAVKCGIGLDDQAGFCDWAVRGRLARKGAFGAMALEVINRLSSKLPLEKVEKILSELQAGDFMRSGEAVNGLFPLDDSVKRYFDAILFSPIAYGVDEVRLTPTLDADDFVMEIHCNPDNPHGWTNRFKVPVLLYDSLVLRFKLLASIGSAEPLHYDLHEGNFSTRIGTAGDKTIEVFIRVQGDGDNHEGVELSFNFPQGRPPAGQAARLSVVAELPPSIPDFNEMKRHQETVPVIAIRGCTDHPGVTDYFDAPIIFGNIMGVALDPSGSQTDLDAWFETSLLPIYTQMAELTDLVRSVEHIHGEKARQTKIKFYQILSNVQSVR